MAAVSAAPTVLSELGILKDKKATSYPSFEGKLDCAEYLQQPYVVDGNVITSPAWEPVLSLPVRSLRH